MSSRKAFFIATAVLAAAITLPAVAAQAADGVAQRSGTMRAGPGSDFPAVDHISRGDGLQVYGCTDGYSWCDVSDGDNRGWFPGSRIAYLRDGSEVILPEVGAAIGIGIIGFGVDEYWQAHYHNRPFFRQENRFVSRYHGPGPGDNHNQPPHVNAPSNNTPPAHVNQTPHVNPPAHQQTHVTPPNHVNPPVQHQVHTPQVHNATPPVHANTPHTPAVHNAPHNPAPCPDGKCH